MKLQKGQTILFTGDSITDCGRQRSVGMGAGLGDGYVAQADSLLSVWYPERSIRVLNTGISGNRVTDLKARWQADVISQAPDWLSIMIGINDVCRQFGSHLSPDQVDIKRYETTFREILEQARPRLKGLVLMTPYFIETNTADPMREKMDAYGSVVKKLSKEFDAIFVDVQKAFDAFLAFRPTQSLCGDRVHPNKTGHMIITRAFLTGIGFEWEKIRQ